MEDKQIKKGSIGDSIVHMSSKNLRLSNPTARRKEDESPSQVIVNQNFLTSPTLLASNTTNSFEI